MLIKNKPSLLSDTFNIFITKYPHLLDFENKRLWFKAEIKKLKYNTSYPEALRLYISRSDVFNDSYFQLRNKTSTEMRGRLSITFTGEDGQDIGGLTREWFILLGKEMFNPN